MKNAALVLFFACALAVVFYAGFRSGEKIPAPVINEVTVNVAREEKTAGTARREPRKPEVEAVPIPVGWPVPEEKESPPAANGTPGTGGAIEEPVPERRAAPEEAPLPAVQTAMGPLELVYPKPMFVGTPAPIRSRNLRPPNKDGGTVTVPAGTKLLSRGRPVAASDPAPLIGELRQITDGDKSAEEGSYIELAGGLQWVQIDLKEVRRIYAVALWHYHLQARAYQDVIVMISNDPEFKSGVLPVQRDVYTGAFFSDQLKQRVGAMLFNNDDDNSAGWSKGSDEMYVDDYRGLVVSGWGIPARYVRLYSNGNTANGMNHYVEVEVYGL